MKQLEGSAIGDPLEVAEMQETLGESLFGLGEYDLAVEVMEKARATRKSRLGPDHPDTLTSMGNLAVATSPPGSWTRPCRSTRRRWPFRKTKLGPDHPDTLLPHEQLGGRLLVDEAARKIRPAVRETCQAARGQARPPAPENAS